MWALGGGITGSTADAPIHMIDGDSWWKKWIRRKEKDVKGRFHDFIV